MHVVKALRPLDLRELLENSLRRFREILEDKKVTLHADLGDVSALVRGDRFRLDQVFTNLISNAIKYGRSCPIAVSLSRNFDLVRVEIVDQGIGIAPQDLERIFNRFERVSSTHNISGLRLGLFICQQIVKAHGGRIIVESELDKGTKFNVELTLDQ